MANEVINNLERIFLVQINTQSKEERGLYRDDYSGSFQPTMNVATATEFESEEQAKKMAEMLNMLYSMTGGKFKAYSAKETINREFLGTELTDKDINSDNETEKETKSK
ncbi:hypothetical protein [Staphylococcus hominis]|uniref:hypothetical protein n=1 Tax=Staphylococcus hominis TaxID=1290 RepID=UPI0015F7DCF9|nr:hypothetical protein [Staphylococcus hominis]